MARSGQFDYPEKSWSEGKMRMAKAGPRGDPGKEYRELEGIRKKKEQILSQNMTSAVPGEANIGTAAGALGGNAVINVMEKTLQNQRNAQGIGDPNLSAQEKKKQGFHPDNLSDDDLLQHYQQSFKDNRPAVLHGSKREFELYMKALDARQEETGENMYRMSPNQLKERGVK